MSTNANYGWPMTTTTTTITIPYTNTTAGTTVIPYTPLTTVGISQMSLGRFGTPSYTDLIDGIRPGAQWFSKGTILRLKAPVGMWDKTDKTYFTSHSNSFFVYMGITEDFDVGKERHWFINDQGSLVQYCFWVYDLSWRGNTKRLFEIVED